MGSGRRREERIRDAVCQWVLKGHIFLFLRAGLPLAILGELLTSTPFLVGGFLESKAWDAEGRTIDLCQRNRKEEMVGKDGSLGMGSEVVETGEGNHERRWGGGKILQSSCFLSSSASDFLGEDLICTLCVMSISVLRLHVCK